MPVGLRAVDGSGACVAGTERYYWKDKNSSYDVFYCLERVAFICRDGLYSGESVLYSIHSSIGSLIGIRLHDNFWLFAHHEPNLVNAYHIGEFYLREISDRFRKAAFIADFKKKSYSWVQETVGKLYCIALPDILLIIYSLSMWPVQIYICWKAIARPPISLLSLNWIFNVQIRTCLTERNQLKFGETDDNADEN